MEDDKRIIDKVKAQLYGWALGDVKRAAKEAKMGGFILTSCLIDYLTCFYFNEDSSGEKYKFFCKKYLPQYNADDLYKSLRCSLVHSYTEGGKYAFTDNKKELHFKVGVAGHVLLNLENFIDDVEKAMDKYFLDINSDIKLREQLIKRYKKVGILGAVKLEYKL